MKVLTKSGYHKVLPILAKVKINHFFAKSVLNGQMDGIVFVDDIKSPSSFYIATQYGMSLLFGEMGNVEFNDSLADYLQNKNLDRIVDEWLQVYPSCWSDVIEVLSGSCFISKEKAAQLPHDLNKYPNSVIQNSRVNFAFNKDKFNQNKLSKLLQNGQNLVSINQEMFDQLQGSVVPKNFWQNANDFVNQGKGFSLYDNENFVAASYSATVDKGTLEVGIETKAECRGKGYAFIVCQAIIEYCLEQGITPVWACRLENIGSYNLAQKLGFEPSHYLPYYRLCKNES